MTDTSYADTFEWVKRIAAVYIASYQQLIMAAANPAKKSAARPRGRKTPRHARPSAGRAC